VLGLAMDLLLKQQRKKLSVRCVWNHADRSNGRVRVADNFSVCLARVRVEDMKTKQDNRTCATRRRRENQGFSLIELLIVVAIILIIAAIAIPNLLHAKMAANEAAAASSIHAINTAEISYSTAYPSVGFSATLADLGPAGAAYLDSTLVSGTKSGYNFLYVQDTSNTPSTGYTLNVDPVIRGSSGQRSFYSDQFNVTHYNQNATAGPTDPVLQ
jgi:type IV pilus assembly protein PilA